MLRDFVLRLALALVASGAVMAVYGVGKL